MDSLQPIPLGSPCFIYGWCHAKRGMEVLLGTDTNVLGSTKEQAEEFAKTAIDNIEHGDYNTYYTKIKNKEKKFWKDFLANL